MPPYSSHLLQPLDVSVYSVLKKSYGRQIENLMRAGNNHIDKPDFLTAYITARKESITTNNTIKGFLATGLVPYDPDYILAKLNTQLRTPTPPPVNVIEEQRRVPQTPHTATDVEFQAVTLKRYMQRYTSFSPSSTDVILQQLVKGYQLAMYSATLLAEENRLLRAENARQKRKKAIKKTYIASGSILTASEGAKRIQNTENASVTENTGPSRNTPIRTPRIYNICRSIEHTARTCPNKL